MMGLAYIVALGAYLLLSVIIVAYAVRYARRKNKSSTLWGFSTALAMYLIPFWDWLPTVLSHQYHCATEAGVWIYKTPEQWMHENPGAIETLTDNSSNYEYPNWPQEKWRKIKITSINQRIGYFDKDRLRTSGEGEIFINTWKWQTSLLDKKTGKILAKIITFTSGNEGYIGGMHSLKFWLTQDRCPGYQEDWNKYKNIVNQLRGKAS